MRVNDRKAKRYLPLYERYPRLKACHHWLAMHAFSWVCNDIARFRNHSHSIGIPDECILFFMNIAFFSDRLAKRGVVLATAAID